MLMVEVYKVEESFRAFCMAISNEDGEVLHPENTDGYSLLTACLCRECTKDYTFKPDHFAALAIRVYVFDYDPLPTDLNPYMVDDGVFRHVDRVRAYLKANPVERRKFIVALTEAGRAYREGRNFHSTMAEDLYYIEDVVLS